MLQVLAYLLRPLVTATGAALLLRPLVDFVSDAKYQKRNVLRRKQAAVLLQPKRERSRFRELSQFCLR